MKKSIQLFSILLVLSFLSFSKNSFGQEKKIKENQSFPGEKKSNNVIPAKNSKQVQTVGEGFQLDENDQYQGRKQEFLSQIIIKEIPVDFPKYEKWMGVKHYNEIIEEYYKMHLDIVKESVKNKLLRK